ncbi:hypothetical protein P9112_010665 [Eukaryota sp. TZLM1-RC]
MRATDSFEALLERRSLEKALDRAKTSFDFQPLYREFSDLTARIFDSPRLPLFLSGGGASNVCTTLLSFDKGSLYQAAHLLSTQTDYKCSISLMSLPPSLRSIFTNPNPNPELPAHRFIYNELSSKYSISFISHNTMQLNTMDYLLFSIALLISKVKTHVKDSIKKSFSRLVSSFLSFNYEPLNSVVLLFLNIFIAFSTDTLFFPSIHAFELANSGLAPIISKFATVPVTVLSKSELYLTASRHLFDLFSSYSSQHDLYLWKAFCKPKQVDNMEFWIYLNYLLYLVPIINLIKSNSASYNRNSSLVVCKVLKVFHPVFQTLQKQHVPAPTTVTTTTALSPLSRRHMLSERPVHDTSSPDPLRLVSVNCSNLKVEPTRLHHDPQWSFQSETLSQQARVIASYLSAVTDKKFAVDCKHCAQQLCNVFHLHVASEVPTPSILGPEESAEQYPASQVLTPKGYIEAVSGASYCTNRLHFVGPSYEKPLVKWEVRPLARLIVRYLRRTAEEDPHKAERLSPLRMLADVRLLVVILIGLVIGVYGSPSNGIYFYLSVFFAHFIYSMIILLLKWLKI